jgi:hypothetical protein
VTWYRIELGGGSPLGLSRALILNALAEVTMRAVRAGVSTRDMAAIATDVLSRDRAVYLSPAWSPWADAVIARFHGRPCAAPDPQRDDLYLLTGTADAATRLLGDALRGPLGPGEPITGADDDVTATLAMGDPSTARRHR